MTDFVQLSVLGAPKIVAHSSETLCRSNLARLVAALVVAGPAGISKGAAIAAVWENEPPPSAETGIRGHVGALRKDLGAAGASLLATRPTGGYVLNVNEQQVDSAVFRATCRQGSAALAAGDLEQAARILAQGLDGWIGVPFEGCDEVRGVLANRAELEEVWKKALLEWCEALHQLWRHEEAIQRLTPVVSGRPTEERLAERLMTLLRTVGRHTEALEVFNRLETCLNAEYGNGPSPALVDLADAISSGPAEADAKLGNPVGSAEIGATTLAGRDQELRRLLEACRAPSHGARLIVVEGPSGIGKTRMLAECGLGLAQDHRSVLFGRADRSTISFGLFRSLFRKADATTSGDPFGTIRRDLARIAPDLARERGASDSHETNERWREELFSAIATWIADLRAPVLLLDDLQWADRDSIDLLLVLCRDSRLRNLTLVASIRTGIVDPGAASPLLDDRMRHDALVRIALGPLSNEELSSIVEEVSGEVERNCDLVEVTGGNPLFAIEHAKRRSGADEHTASLELVVQARLAHLGEAGREVARVASVLGTQFHQRDVLLGLLDETFFERGIAQCIADGLLVASSTLGQHEFVHGLLREEIERTVPVAVRQALHHRIFLALAADDAERRITHAIGASALLSSGDLLEAWRSAGESALRKAAFTSSAECFEQALAIQQEHAPLNRTDECHLLIRFAQTQLHISEAKSEALLREAARLARPLGDPALIADIADVRLGMDIAPNPIDEKLLAAALSWPATARDANVESRLLSRQAVELLGVDPTAGPHHLATRARRLADRVSPGPAQDLCRLRSLWALSLTGEFQQTRSERRAAIDEFRSLADALNRVDFLILAESRVAVDALTFRDYAAARAAADRMASLATRQSWPRYQAHALAMQAAIALEQGDVETEERLSQQAAGLVERAGYEQGMVYVQVGRTVCLNFNERTMFEVEPMLRDMWELDNQPAIVGCALGCATAALGAAALAMQAIDEAAGEDLSRLPRDTVYSAGLTFIAAASFHLRTDRYAHEGLRLAESLRGTNVVAGAAIGLFGPIEASIGRFKAALGDVEGAKAELREALDICDALGAKSPGKRISMDLEVLSASALSTHTAKVVNQRLEVSPRSEELPDE